MDIYESWQKALKGTEIVRSRVQSLKTFEDTHAPYILLSRSTINLGDTIVRKGEVLVEKPSLILPPHIPQFNGFEFDAEDHIKENSVVNFLLVRGIHLPSFRYNNKTSSLDMYEGDLRKAADFYKDDLQRRENVHMGLIVGPEDCWQFSLVLYICSQIAKNAAIDIQRLLDEFQKKK